MKAVLFIYLVYISVQNVYSFKEFHEENALNKCTEELNLNPENLNREDYLKFTKCYWGTNLNQAHGINYEGIRIMLIEQLEKNRVSGEYSGEYADLIVDKCKNDRESFEFKSTSEKECLFQALRQVSGKN